MDTTKEQLEEELRSIDTQIDGLQVQRDAVLEKLTPLVSPFQANDIIENYSNLYSGRWLVIDVRLIKEYLGWYRPRLKVRNVKKDGRLGERRAILTWDLEKCKKVGEFHSNEKADA